MASRSPHSPALFVILLLAVSPGCQWLAGYDSARPGRDDSAVDSQNTDDSADGGLGDWSTPLEGLRRDMGPEADQVSADLDGQAGRDINAPPQDTSPPTDLFQPVQDSSVDSSPDGAPPVLLAKSLTSTNPGATAQSVAVDSAGNIYVAGSFTGSLYSDGLLYPSIGSSDIFIVSFESTGNVRWTQTYGSTGDDEALGVAVDSAGNPTITGYFGGRMNVGATLSGVGDEAIFVLSLDSAANHRWSNQFGGSTTTARERGNAIAVDSQNNVVVAGQFSGSVNFGAGTHGTGGQDAFVLSLSSAGTARWSDSYASPYSGTDQATAVATGPSDEVAITGYSIGGAVPPLFAITYNSNGTSSGAPKTWTTNATHLVSHSITIDGRGYPTIAGFYEGSAHSFGNGCDLVSQGIRDGFVAQFDQSLRCRWALTLGSGGYDDAWALRAAANNDLHVTGYISAATDLCGPLSTQGRDEVYWAQLDPSGGCLGATTLGGAGNDRGLSIALGPGGQVYLAGYYTGPADFGSYTLSSTGQQGFVIALDP